MIMEFSEQEPIPLPDSAQSTLRLLHRVRSGDEDALDALYKRYLRPLQRWAHGRLPRWARNLMETDDLVQATMMQTLRRVQAFDPRHSGAFQAYLRRGVLNAIRDEIRRVHRAPMADGSMKGFEALAPSPLAETIGRETLERYDSALKKMRPADREAIVARVELGFTYRQIADILSKPSADAARMAVSRALLRLAREMSA